MNPYTAAVERAALIDRSTQGKISITGADRASFLHALLTNDIARLTPGTGVYSAYLTPQGRMISDMRVVETGDEMLLGVDAAVAGSLAERLDSLIFSEDVQIRNVTRELGEIDIVGPLSSRMIEAALGIPARRLDSLHEYDNVKAPGSALTLVRDDGYGVTGFAIYAPIADAERVAGSLIDAGAVRADEQIAEVLRIEAGRPAFGADMDTDTIPLEAGIEGRAISMTKGCYVGQEVIVRVLHRGHGRVARKLVRLEFNGNRVPAAGDRILVEGQDVGRVTSAVFSPKANAPLALGYVHRDHAEGGRAVAVKSGEDLLEAKVRQLGDEVGISGREFER